MDILRTQKALAAGGLVVDRQYVEAVVSALNIMDAAGLALYGRQISGSTLDAWCLALKIRNIRRQEILGAAASFVSRSEKDFPTPGIFADRAHALRGSQVEKQVLDDTARAAAAEDEARTAEFVQRMIDIYGDAQIQTVQAHMEAVLAAPPKFAPVKGFSTVRQKID